MENFAQGVEGRIKGTKTIYFIKYRYISEDQKATYGHIVVNYHTQKEYPYQTRLTVVGNFINYPGYVGTPMPNMLKAKLRFNMVLLRPYSKFMVIDINNFYLKIPMA